MKEVVIDRNNWWRGQTDANSRLLNDEGKLCCLGFLCLSMAATEKQIENVSFPSRVWSGIEKWLPRDLRWLSGEFSTHPDGVGSEEFEVVIGRYNDDPNLSEPDREAYVIKTFAEHDIAVTFIN